MVIGIQRLTLVVTAELMALHPMRRESRQLRWCGSLRRLHPPVFRMVAGIGMVRHRPHVIARRGCNAGHAGGEQEHGMAEELVHGCGDGGSSRMLGCSGDGGLGRLVLRPSHTSRHRKTYMATRLIMPQTSEHTCRPADEAIVTHPNNSVQHQQGVPSKSVGVSAARQTESMPTFARTLPPEIRAVRGGRYGGQQPTSAVFVKLLAILLDEIIACGDRCSS